jgi:predicted DNA-binding transcriptional regulator AlpA
VKVRIVGKPSPAAALAELPEPVLDAIAERVVERLFEVLPAQRADALIDAAELARRLGRSRAWVYEHADELGAIRLGDGPRPRVAFDPAEVQRLLRARGTSPASAGPQAPEPARRRWPSRSGAVQLLPVRGRSE